MVIDKILAIAPRESKVDRASDDLFNSVELELQAAKLARLIAYLYRRNISYSIENADYQKIIRLSTCLLRPGQDDGRSAIFVNADGTHQYACFHAKCAGKGWDEVEAVHGQLYPSIKTGADIDRVIVEALAAMRDIDVYQLAGTLVKVQHSPDPPRYCHYDNGAPRLTMIHPDHLTELLATAAKWLSLSGKGDKKKWTHCKPPKDIVNAIHRRGSYPLPVATGIVHSPIVLPNGGIVAGRGYNRDTGLYLDVESGYPPLMETKAALELLLDVVADFPFQTEAHRSGWLAALLTLCCRNLIATSTPFFPIDGNRSRVGKGLATDIITMIYEGRLASRYDAPSTRDEMRKMLTTVAVSGRPYILFDNINGKFGGSAIEAAITSGRHSDRLLGVNADVDLPLRCCWLGTANNMVLTSDMVGRTCHIRLETDSERPETRSGFRHPNLIDYVRDNRKQLTIAALSIVSNFLRAGRPDQRLSSWGGFDEWSDLIRGAIVWAKLDDPGETRDALRESADDDSQQLSQLVAGWGEFGKPLTVAEGMRLIDAQNLTSGDEYETLRDLVAGLVGNKHRELGKLLKDARRKRIDGQYLDRTDGKRPKWFVAAGS